MPFKKPCRICQKTFEPQTKHTRLCNKCRLKAKQQAGRNSKRTNQKKKVINRLTEQLNIPIIKMNKPLKNAEQLVLFRSLLKDGMTPTEANAYIKVLKEEVKSSHNLEVKNILTKRKEKTFAEKFRDMRLGK